MSLIKEVELLVGQPRSGSTYAASCIVSRMFRAEIDAGFPLVVGEGESEIPAYPGGALIRLNTGRSKTEGGGPVGFLEAFMQAEVVAAGIAAAHEIESSEPVSPEDQKSLHEQLMAYGLRIE